MKQDLIKFEREVYGAPSAPDEEKAEVVEPAEHTRKEGKSEANGHGHDEDEESRGVYCCCCCTRIQEPIRVAEIPSLEDRVRDAEDVLAKMCAHTKAHYQAVLTRNSISGSFEFQRSKTYGEY